MTHRKDVDCKRLEGVIANTTITLVKEGRETVDVECGYFVEGKGCRVSVDQADAHEAQRAATGDGSFTSQAKSLLFGFRKLKQRVVESPIIGGVVSYRPCEFYE
jgi:hypothetical protein|tara:strand:+ start:634 stop:945 length:312 start_codon:yes stop_codon:yes gene_type:complete